MEGLKNDYDALNQPLQKAGSLDALIKQVEIELSKNSTFQVMDMSHLGFNSSCMFCKFLLSLMFYSRSNISGLA